MPIVQKAKDNLQAHRHIHTQMNCMLKGIQCVLMGPHDVLTMSLTMLQMMSMLAM